MNIIFKEGKYKIDENSNIRYKKQQYTMIFGSVLKQLSKDIAKEEKFRTGECSYITRCVDSLLEKEDFKEINANDESVINYLIDDIKILNYIADNDLVDDSYKEIITFGFKSYIDRIILLIYNDVYKKINDGTKKVDVIKMYSFYFKNKGPKYMDALLNKLDEIIDLALSEYNLPSKENNMDSINDEFDFITSLIYSLESKHKLESIEVIAKYEYAQKLIENLRIKKCMEVLFNPETFGKRR